MFTFSPATLTRQDGTTWFATVATITGAYLGAGDHGRVIFSIEVDRETSFGNFALSKTDKETGEQVGCDYAMDMLIKIMRVVGVSSWGKLPGSQVYILQDQPLGRIVGLANLKNIELSYVLDVNGMEIK